MTKSFFYVLGLISISGMVSGYFTLNNTLSCFSMSLGLYLIFADLLGVVD